MTFNLLDRVKDRIDEALLARLGNAIGTDGSAMPIVLSGALPGLLAGVCAAALRPEGARTLLDGAARRDGIRIAESPDAPLDALPDALPDRATVDRLRTGLSRFAGIDHDRAAAVIALLAPPVLDTLHRHVHDRRLDADGLAAMLLAQRNAIDAAMPSAFTEELEALGFFATVAGQDPA